MGISIIIPFWNMEKYLEEAVESVLAQTYRDWEVVFVDDGSTDGSPLIALKYVQQYTAAQAHCILDITVEQVKEAAVALLSQQREKMKVALR